MSSQSFVLCGSRREDGIYGKPTAMPDHYRYSGSVSGSLWHSSARRSHWRHQTAARVYGNTIFSYMPHTGYKSKRGEGNILRWALNNIVRISSLSLWYRSVSGRADNNERLLCMFHLPCLAQCEVWFCTAQRGCLVWTTWETTAILSQIEKM